MANVVLLRAYYERPNFYSAAVYISQSTGSLMFLVNLMLIVAASFGFGLQRLFYGPLRPIETEQLYDHLPRRYRHMVLHHVPLPACWESVAVDR
jgi:E3 ubiquitin-protein ligase synoviolin